jgi:citronellyl-CoA dehydrogenase
VVREFVESELAPHAQEWEQETVPDWVFKRAGDLGLLGVLYPEEYSGQGDDRGHAIVGSEELARVGLGGVGMGLAVQTRDGHHAHPEVRH